MEWWQILTIVLGSLLLLFVLSIIFYKPFFKRFWDIVLSVLAIVVLSPILLILSLLGLIFMQAQSRNEQHHYKQSSHKMFSDCSRIFSSSSFIRTTAFWIPAWFALDPVVFISRPISWIMNPSFLPGYGSPFMVSMK